MDQLQIAATVRELCDHHRVTDNRDFYHPKQDNIKQLLLALERGELVIVKPT